MPRRKISQGCRTGPRTYLRAQLVPAVAMRVPLAGSGIRAACAPQPASAETTLRGSAAGRDPGAAGRGGPQSLAPLPFGTATTPTGRFFSPPDYGRPRLISPAQARPGAGLSKSSHDVPRSASIASASRAAFALRGAGLAWQ